MSREVKTVVIEIGALSNAAAPIFYVPAGYGGITLLGGYATMRASADSQLALVTMATPPTENGTISAVLGTAAPGHYVANTPKTFTISTAYVSEETWVGVKEMNVGAANAVTHVTLNYITGK